LGAPTKEREEAFPIHVESGLDFRREGVRVVDVAATGASVRPAGWISAGRLRLAAFLVIAAFMIAGPAAEQIFGLRTAFLRSWTMFSGIGLGVIDASFAIRQPDASLAPLDRFAMLGAPRNGKLKHIETRDELASIIKRLCAAAGQGADIRVSARQGTSDGWRVVHTDTANACAD
jgi:hypothetical protein